MLQMAINGLLKSSSDSMEAGGPKQTVAGRAFGAFLEHVRAHKCFGLCGNGKTLPTLLR